MEEKAYTFLVDSERMDELSLILHNSSKELQEVINAIYRKIDEMSSAWSGVVYQEFVRTCASYRSALEANVILLKAFSTSFNKMSRDGEFLEKNISSYLNKVQNSIFVLTYDRGEVDE